MLKTKIPSCDLRCEITQMRSKNSLKLNARNKYVSYEISVKNMCSYDTMPRLHYHFACSVNRDIRILTVISLILYKVNIITNMYIKFYVGVIKTSW